MKIIIRNVKYISKTAEIITNKYIIRFNPFGVRIIMVNVENLNFFNFGNQTLSEFISGIILNIFDVKHKVEIIFSTE
jgi:hypothetical protein